MMLFNRFIYPHVRKDLIECSFRDKLLSCIYLKCNTIQQSFVDNLNIYNFVDCFKYNPKFITTIFGNTNQLLSHIIINYSEEIGLTVPIIEKNLKYANNKFHLQILRHLEYMDGKRRIEDLNYLDLEQAYLNILDKYFPLEISKMIWNYVEIN